MNSIKYNIQSWLLSLFAILLIYACKHEAQQPDKSIQTLFAKGCNAQRVGNNEQAMQLFQQCLQQSIHKQGQTDAPNDSVADIFSRALVQLLNVYQSEGKVNECVDYFRRLKQQTANTSNPLLTITQRDIYIIYA